MLDLHAERVRQLPVAAQRQPFARGMALRLEHDARVDPEPDEGEIEREERHAAQEDEKQTHGVTLPRGRPLAQSRTGSIGSRLP